MIVISGALVLVALVLLIIGVVGPDLAFVYASIAVSLVSLVFLVVGILQRRGDPATAGTEQAGTPVSVDDPAEGITVRPSASRRIPTPDEPVDEADDEPLPVGATSDGAAAVGGDVLVVEGRPRYHVVGCRYLSGKTPEIVDVVQAGEEGFTPCGVCKPDLALAALAAEEAALAPETEELALPEADPEQDVPAVPVPAVPVPAAGRRTGTRGAARPARSAAPAVTPARAARTTAAPAAVPAPAVAPAPATRRAAAARASTRAAVAPVAAPTRAAAPRGGSVVVIPDRGKYHREQCRYVRDVAGTEVLSKTAATRQGYAACGVCKP